jgi:hypothetical protein
MFDCEYEMYRHDLLKARDVKLNPKKIASTTNENSKNRNGWTCSFQREITSMSL